MRTLLLSEECIEGLQREYFDLGRYFGAYRNVDCGSVHETHEGFLDIIQTYRAVVLADLGCRLILVA